MTIIKPGVMASRLPAYDIGVAWEPSTFRYKGIFGEGSDTSTYSSSTARGMCVDIRNSEKRLFIGNSVTDRVVQYSLSSKWDFDSATFVRERDSGFSTTANPYTGVWVDDGGTVLFTTGYNIDAKLGNNEAYIEQFNISSWNIDAGGGKDDHRYIGDDMECTNLFMPPDGKAYIYQSGANKLQARFFTSVFDLTTATGYTSNETFTDRSEVSGFTLDENGTKLFIVDDVDQVLARYDLSTAWEPHTASFVEELDISAQLSTTYTARAVMFEPDGEYCHIMVTGPGCCGFMKYGIL